jgi:gamma-glutamylcyclotransferase (GGCT)/AIG2-like uncharacterized protein YtfP
MHRIFVYGSLLRGQANHGLLADSRYVGPAETPPRYTLVDLGEFPGLLAGGSTAVAGEVYEVSAATLARLDRLEEHPHAYERRPIVLASGEPAEAYLLHAHRRRGAPEIRTGCWPETAPAGAQP